MSQAVEKTVQDGDVLVREHGALRRLTLNRPKALNALTLGMAATMTTYLRAWADDETVGKGQKFPRVFTIDAAAQKNAQISAEKGGAIEVEHIADHRQIR